MDYRTKSWYQDAWSILSSHELNTDVEIKKGIKSYMGKGWNNPFESLYLFLSPNDFENYVYDRPNTLFAFFDKCGWDDRFSPQEKTFLFVKLWDTKFRVDIGHLNVVDYNLNEMFSFSRNLWYQQEYKLSQITEHVDFKLVDREFGFPNTKSIISFEFVFHSSVRDLVRSWKVNLNLFYLDLSSLQKINILGELALGSVQHNTRTEKPKEKIVEIEDGKTV